MIIIGDKIISDELLDMEFVCNLNACKGACCVEGDAGAIIEEDEALGIAKNLEQIIPFLTEAGIKAIRNKGIFEIRKKRKHTMLINKQACAFITYDKDGKASCGIEKAWEAGKSDVRKPISCHLYPVRINKVGTHLALNYNQWDICDPACQLGKSMQMPIYMFVKDALIRKFGEAFFNTLMQADDYRISSNKKTQAG